MSVINPASNYPNLAQLNNAVLSCDVSGNVENLIQSFLVDLSANTYTPMVNALNGALGTYGVGTNSTLRILLAVDDGTVAYDSSKGVSNTYANYTAGTINENHNTRPEIMVAILGNSGVGISNRYSRTSAAFLKYQATRLGSSTQTNLGTFRVSLKDVN